MAASLLVYCIPFLAFLILYARRRQRHSLSDIRKPPGSSWLLGHQALLSSQKQVGDLVFEWINNYGSVFRLDDCFGDQVLFLADPVALRYVTQTSRYTSSKTIQNRTFHRLMGGKGIIGADAHDHRRHRRIMSPAFTTGQVKSFAPIFQSIAQTLADKWTDLIMSSKEDTIAVSVNEWLSKATLDAIGQAGFQLDFGSLDNKETELTRVYHNLFADTQHEVPKAVILFQASWTYLPILSQFIEHIPFNPFTRIKKYMTVAARVARGIIGQKQEELSRNSEPSKDVMSLLVKANLSENFTGRLRDDEMVGQMMTLLLAGHETSSSTATWILHELTLHPEYQDQIRAEILKTQTSSGFADQSTLDFDNMPILNAFIKETLRFHPIAFELPRVMDRDDVIPLSKPLESISGRAISEIPVRKGQGIHLSVCGYNRLPEVWGEDAHLFNPQRFLTGEREKNRQGLGVYADLLTFSAGPRSCIGWRFALLELQIFISTILKRFKIAPQPGVEILRAPAHLMMPLVKGREKEGSNMPLLLSIAA